MCSANRVPIHLDDRVARGELLALRDLHGERISIELDGVDADMHQHFQTRVGGDTDGVLGLSDCGHLAGHRCDDRA